MTHEEKLKEALQPHNVIVFNGDTGKWKVGGHFIYRLNSEGKIAVGCPYVKVSEIVEQSKTSDPYWWVYSVNGELF